MFSVNTGPIPVENYTTTEYPFTLTILALI